MSGSELTEVTVHSTRLRRTVSRYSCVSPIAFSDHGMTRRYVSVKPSRVHSISSFIILIRARLEICGDLVAYDKSSVLLWYVHSACDGESMLAMLPRPHAHVYLDTSSVQNVHTCLDPWTPPDFRSPARFRPTAAGASHAGRLSSMAAPVRPRVPPQRLAAPQWRRDVAQLCPCY